MTSASKILSAGGASEQAEALELRKLILDGAGVDATIGDALIDAPYERTIEGASTLTLTVFDEAKELINSKIFNEAVDAAIGDLRFTVVRIEKQGAGLYPLTFEDRAVALMRRYDKPKKAYRDKVTRAEFALSLVREVKEQKIEFYCPELHKRQPIKGGEKSPRNRKVTKKIGDDDRARGLGPDENLAIKGEKATPYQLHNAEIALNEGSGLGANTLAMLAMLVSGIGESGFRAVPNTSGSGYAGVFQAHPKNIPMEDTKQQAHYFFVGGKGFQAGGAINLAKTSPGMSPGTIATKVEASGQPGSFYDKYIGEAKAILAAYGGAGGSGSATVTTSEKTTVKRYAFTRGQGGKRENTWDCLLRLAEEVGWRRFMVGNRMYFISEEDLYMSRVRAKLKEGEGGVDEIQWSVDTGGYVNEATVIGRADQWKVPPGAVVELVNEGPANGKWLVSRLSGSLFSEAVTIELKQPTAELPEPAPEVETASDTSISGGGGSAPGGAIKGSPKEIIDNVVIPIARDCGVNVSPASVAAANARHGATVSGGRSDHQGPPQLAWAADMSNGGSPTPQMDKLARRLADRFNITWHGSGLVSVTHGGYRYQLIYRTNQGGNHFNHVHFGVKKV